MWDQESGGAAFTERTEDSGCCGKACNALCMVCLGIFCLPLALYLLAWNENTYVCENNRILVAEQDAGEVQCKRPQAVDQFAFFSCPLVPESLQEYTPCTFNAGKMDCSTQPPISFRSAFGIQNVEMYQCQESCSDKTTKNSLGQNVKVRTCTYSMGWSGMRIDSSRFERPASDVNQGCPNFGTAGGNPSFPTNLVPGQQSDYAQTLEAGAGPGLGYVLNHDLVQQLSSARAPVSLAPSASKFTGPSSAPPWLRPLAVSTNNLVVNGNYLETCRMYQIGCVRISYTQFAGTGVSVISHVNSMGVTSPETVKGTWGCSAKPWQAITPKQSSKATVIADLRAENKMRVWMIRVLGLVGCWLAFYCCMQPISAAADIMGDLVNWLPCGGYLEDFIEGVVDTVLCFMSCGLGCSCGFVVIAVVWLYMRPLIGGGLVLIAGCCCFGAFAIRQAAGAPNRKHRDIE